MNALIALNLKKFLQLENDHVDALAKLAIMKFSYVNWLVIRSIMLTLLIKRNKFMCINENKCWMDLIKAYLKNQAFPKDKTNANKIKK